MPAWKVFKLKQDRRPPLFFVTRFIFATKRASAGVALFLCVWSSQAQFPQPAEKRPRPEKQSSIEGRKAFESTCAGCHGLDGRGGERGPDISARPDVLQLSDTETLQYLQKGNPAAGMPAFGSLGSEKLKSLLTYLRTLQGKGDAEAVPGNPQSGKITFFGKARCSECHMINGLGGFLGSDLSTYSLTRGAGDTRSAITNASTDVDPPRRIVAVTMRDGRKFTGVARNEDNFSLQLQSVEGTFHLLSKSEVERIEILSNSLMPTDYGSTLSSSEVDDLVSYLISVARKNQSKGSKRREEDE
ncbi:MAG TPA: c-type cytochrome [Candidatus Acidoferrum sp.]|nr:c-type cytochrome [Candidatus Acidoferrum sp.]